MMGVFFFFFWVFFFFFFPKNRSSLLAFAPSTPRLFSRSLSSASAKVFGSKVPSKVTICEVGCRDGLQNEKTVVPTDVKVELIHRLRDSGLEVIEATSFVSPKWVPQMADSRDVLESLDQSEKRTRYPVLVPNQIGFKNAISSGAKAVAFFTAASETFCKKNMNCTYDESIARYEACLADIPEDVHVRGYISCVLGCPYEGHIEPKVVGKVAKQLMGMGCHEISLGDTIGVGTAGATVDMLEEVLQHVSPDKVAVHFHDTYGQALANILASLQVMCVLAASTPTLHSP